jgi:hypothetical protein
MVLQTPALQSLTLNVMLERTETGQTVASVLELPGYRVEAPTEEQAIAQLKQLAISRLTKAKIVPLELPLEQPHDPNPWTEFIGMFEGDIEFATLAAELRAERGLNMDGVA